MIRELALATFMVGLTVLVHGVGLTLLARLLRSEAHEEAVGHIHPGSARGLAVTLVAIIALVGLHGIEIWLYAFLYMALGAIAVLRDAVYFSTITYGAIGYSDTVMAEQWRLVSAIEGINGILMIGWSTAFFVTVIGRLRRV
jgi:hypothetical protein